MVKIGSLDRSAHSVPGLALLAAPFPLPDVFAPLGQWRFANGAVLMGTALFRICPAYLPFGMRTCDIGRR